MIYFLLPVKAVPTRSHACCALRLSLTWINRAPCHTHHEPRERLPRRGRRRSLTRLHPHVGTFHGVVVMPAVPRYPPLVLRPSRIHVLTVQIGVITTIVPPGARVSLGAAAAAPVMVGVERAKVRAVVIG